MGDAVEGRGPEAPVIRDVIRPGDARVDEDFAEEDEIGSGQRARGESLDGVTGHNMGSDGAKLAGAAVEEVGRHRLGAREPSHLVADRSEPLGEVRGRADDSGHGEKARGLPQSLLEGVPAGGRYGRFPESWKAGRRGWRGSRRGVAHCGYDQYTRTEPGRTSGLIHSRGFIPLPA